MSKFNDYDPSELSNNEYPVDILYDNRPGYTVKLDVNEWFHRLTDLVLRNILQRVTHMAVMNSDTVVSCIVVSYALGEFIERVDLTDSTNDVKKAFQNLFSISRGIAEKDEDMPDTAFGFIKEELMPFVAELNTMCREAMGYGD